MGVREGGSYVADDAGTETLVGRTHQPDPVGAVAVPVPPEVMSAPAVTPVETAGTDRLDGGAPSKPQE